MNKEELRHILQQPYQQENWKKVVDFVFPNVSYLKSPQPIPFSNEKVESFKQLGTVRLKDGKNLAMFEVKVSPNVNIPRNRVELRNLVAPLIDQDRNHGVLVIYEQGSEDYRFTFTAKETVFDDEKADFVNRETESKRFTYLLGGNESCRTPGDRLWELSAKKEVATIKDIENAFSVERLSKEFFTKYKQQYQAFVDYLAASHFNASAFNGDEKRIRDFVKVLLGRIVFLQFVQKKRWLGASDTNFNDGDKNFLQHFWNQSGKNESFYYAHLSRLFFEALNKNERTGQQFEMPDGIKVCVPYLGGGLFEKDRNEPDLLTYPPALFEGLFNFFAEYNFTIDENDPFENEVGIDPEMLGHIFENLLEDNKDKGAFYTPKPIVKYMCQESLIQYLITQLEQNKVFEADTEIKADFEQRVGRFVKKYEAHDLIDYDAILARALHTIKVCDPAIGSGAFPMGILNEMVMLINVLHNASPDVVQDIWQMDNWQPATVKKHIIQNSIYGVDIEKGAVDIARLRFWLSLILDEEKPNALPSLDYKIVVGNSLVSKLGDDIIDIDWTLNRAVPDLFGEDMAQRKRELLENLSQKQFDFYQLNSNKQQLAEEIRIVKIDLLIHQLQLMIEKKERAEPKIENYRNRPKLKFTEDYNKYLQYIGWQNQIENLKRLKKDPNKPLEYFDWNLNFPEVMNPNIAKTVGYDIVIGNPPYGATLSAIDKSFFQTKYETSKTIKGIQKGSLDTFTLFIELGHYLSNTGGNLHYIVPISITSSDSMEGVHRLIESDCSEIKISSYAVRPQPVFENAVVNTSILFFKKDGKPCEKIYTTKMYRKNSELNLKHLVDNLEFIEVKDLKIKGRYPKISHDIERKILRKIFSNETKIGDLLKPKGKSIYYRTTGGRYYKIVTNYSTGSTKERPINFEKNIANSIGAILSSNLFFWFYQIFSNNLDLKSYEIEVFGIPADKLDDNTKEKLERIYSEYLKEIEKNANVRLTEKYANINSFKEYKIGKSKHLIDKIDELIGPLYGLTKEEIDFIKKYELNYRLQEE